MTRTRDASPVFTLASPTTLISVVAEIHSVAGRHVRGSAIVARVALVHSASYTRCQDWRDLPVCWRSLLLFSERLLRIMDVSRQNR